MNFIDGPFGCPPGPIPDLLMQCFFMNVFISSVYSDSLFSMQSLMGLMFTCRRSGGNLKIIPVFSSFTQFQGFPSTVFWSSLHFFTSFNIFIIIQSHVFDSSHWSWSPISSLISFLVILIIFTAFTEATSIERSAQLNPMIIDSLEWFVTDEGRIHREWRVFSRLNFWFWFVNILPLMGLVVTTTMIAYALHYD